jgi:predicted TIM-barrel fold metal-dependent hydrolase
VATSPFAVESINKFMADAVSSKGGRLIALAALHPESKDIAGDVAAAMDMGLSGVKVHPDFQRFELDGSASFSMFEHVAGRLPALIHTGDARYSYSNPRRAAALLRRFPELTAVCAHLGGWSEWDEAEDELAELKNVYVDTSSTLYELDPERALHIIRRFGADRVLFGSDYPMWDPGAEIARLRSLGLCDDELTLILEENAKKIFMIH